MREDDFRNALAQIELPAEAQQRIIDACAAGIIHVAPQARLRRKRMFASTAIAAAVILLLAGGALLPRLSNPNHSFTITAYALDASGATTLGTPLTDEAADFELSINLDPYGTAAGSLWSGKACGELSAGLRFYCEGENIASITYSGENCRFVEDLVLTNWYDYYDEYGGNKRDLYAEENIIQIMWPWGEAGPNEAGYALRLLGESYTECYAQQGEKNLRVQLPVYRLEDATGADYTLLFSREETPPSGVTHAANYKTPTYTQQYVAQNAFITVTVTFTDGKTQQKLLRLTPLKQPQSFPSDYPEEYRHDLYLIRMEVVE